MSRVGNSELRGARTIVRHSKARTQQTKLESKPRRVPAVIAHNAGEDVGCAVLILLNSQYCDEEYQDDSDMEDHKSLGELLHPLS